MDNARFQRVIPYKLQRRISRLIKIDDVLKEDSTSTEQIEPCLENVMWKYKYSYWFSFFYRLKFLFPQDSESLDNRICIEPLANPKPLYEEETNWIEEYIGGIRKDRVKWESKLYAADRRFSNKSIYEQVEDLMDIVSNLNDFKIVIIKRL